MYSRSVSDDHDVYVVFVLSGLGRGSMTLTSSLMTTRLTKRRSGPMRSVAHHAQPK